MLRTRRSNSDLDSSKVTRSTRNNSFRDGADAVDSQKISIYEPKMTHSIKTNMSENNNKKNNPQEFITDTYRLLKHYYQKQDSQYFTKVKKYLNVEWEGQKKLFNQHLNKLTYLENDMQKRNFNEIECEIIAQWRRNPVLYSIRAFWYEVVSTTKYSSIGEFNKEYNNFKDFVGQMAFLFFKRFFLVLGSDKEIEKVLDKLTQRTSHMLISHTKTWCGICDKIVIPLLKEKLSVYNLENVSSSDFSLEKLGVKTIAIDLQSKSNQMPKTTDSIQKFILEFKLLDKMKLLIQIRSNMEAEIRKRQEHMIKTGQLKQIKVLDKDDFVDCLIYCVIKGDISLQDLGVSLKYFFYILGADSENILSKFRCDPYFADLVGVFDFLVENMASNDGNKQNASTENKK